MQNEVFKGIPRTFLGRLLPSKLVKTVACTPPHWRNGSTWTWTCASELFPLWPHFTPTSSCARRRALRLKDALSNSGGRTASWSSGTAACASCPCPLSTSAASSVGDAHCCNCVLAGKAVPSGKLPSFLMRLALSWM